MTKELQTPKYYDGTKLLSLMDINGNKPELYLCTTNRSGGKTTYFGRKAVNNFLKNGKKKYLFGLMLLSLILCNIHVAVWPFYFILYFLLFLEQWE